MKTLDVIIVIVLLALLAVGAYLFWQFLPGTPVEYEDFASNISLNTGQGIQFYPNMRYRDRRISYTFEDECDIKKKAEVEEAFSILSDKTILEFYSQEEGEIRILCSQVAPEPEEEGHFVAGEGGPSVILNTTNYYVITLGKVSLYRHDKCDNPKIALHEIIHSLGFDHNANKSSIMYPVTNCNQEIDSYVIDTINQVYKADSLPDLAIERVNAVKRGIYVDFNITIGNYGLRDAGSSKLKIYTNEGEVKVYNMSNISMSVKTILSVENLRIFGNAQKIRFVIDYSGNELSKDNNAVELSLPNG